MAKTDTFVEDYYKELKPLMRNAVLRCHQQWQDSIAALINSPYPEGENAFDRSMEITKRARDFFKQAMRLEDSYSRSRILFALASLYADGYLTDADIATLSPTAASGLATRLALICG